MYTSTFVRRYIYRLPYDRIFSTREVLNCGKRAAIDKCLSRLVKRGEIIRLARGLFKRFDSAPLPSAFLVAYHKAMAFGRSASVNPVVVARTLELFNGEVRSALGNNSNNKRQLTQFTYMTTGHSSKFKFGTRTIYLQGVSHRKMHLSKSIVGLIMMAAWYLGKVHCSKKAVMSATSSFNRDDRNTMRQLRPFLPTWLLDKLSVY